MEALSTDGRLAALIVPLRQMNLVVPQSLMAEVVMVPEVEEVVTTEPWLRGLIEWRGAMLPLVALESFCLPLVEDRPSRARRVAVFHAVCGLQGLSHYAVDIQAIPHPLRLGPADLRELASERRCAIAAQEVQAAGVKAMIPDLDTLEQRIAQVMQRA